MYPGIGTPYNQKVIPYTFYWMRIEIFGVMHMPTRVIIADDETIQRMDLKDILTRQGYLVIGEAGDGVSAVNLARELRPDLVIMDIRMPDMDGITAAETLTQEKLAPVLL